MTEIRLKRIVDRTNQEQGYQLSDGDEIMIKDGVSISEFSKETMGLGKEVYADEGNAPIILKKVYVLYEKYVLYVKAMDWTSKIATAQVIRSFIRGTPVVKKCGSPLCISSLVIAPKFAPGQVKYNPDNGFVVSVLTL